MQPVLRGLQWGGLQTLHKQSFPQLQCLHCEKNFANIWPDSPLFQCSTVTFCHLAVVLKYKLFPASSQKAFNIWSLWVLCPLIFFSRWNHPSSDFLAGDISQISDHFHSSPLDTFEGSCIFFEKWFFKGGPCQCTAEQRDHCLILQESFCLLSSQQLSPLVPRYNSDFLSHYFGGRRERERDSPSFKIKLQSCVACSYLMEPSKFFRSCLRGKEGPGCYPSEEKGNQAFLV